MTARLPRRVVRRHRTKATVIWVSLLIAFVGYVAFVVYDTVKSRQDPASSFQIEQEYYTFPDVAICLQQYEGCLATITSNCIATASMSMLTQYGFLEEDLEPNEASAAAEDVYDCKVLPVSQLTVDQTGVDNGDITSFFVRLAMFWSDDPQDEYDPTDAATSTITTQFVSVFFVDLDKGVEVIGEMTNNAKLPYDRILAVNGETMVATTNHLVLDLTQFVGISETSGETQEAELTYTPATTSGQVNWYWDDEDITTEIAAVFVDLFIPRFEFTRVKEVDPVNAWAIMGAIGGVWQFVVIAFGLFFVFSEKQAPDKKMRNFRKSVTKPVSIIGRRFSSVSRESTSQHVEIDAADEDLPAGWVKRQRMNGSMYYCNTMTGEMRDDSPHEADAVATGAPVGRPRRGINRLFRPAHQSAPNDGHEAVADCLPPGWVGRVDSNGTTYYVNTVLNTTSSQRPQQHPHSTGGPGVQVLDGPVSRARSSFPQPTAVASVIASAGDGSHVTRAPSDSSHAAAVQPPTLPSRTAAPAAAPAANPAANVDADAAVVSPAPMPQAPSYRTMMSLSGASGETSTTTSAYASTGGARGGGGGGGGSLLSTHASIGEAVGGVGGVGDVGGGSVESIPSGWQPRTTPDGKTCALLLSVCYVRACAAYDCRRFAGSVLKQCRIIIVSVVGVVFWCCCCSLKCKSTCGYRVSFVQRRWWVARCDDFGVVFSAFGNSSIFLDWVEIEQKHLCARWYHDKSCYRSRGRME
ncbi:unnamed protein product [Pylaiella littoralis]